MDSPVNLNKSTQFFQVIANEILYVSVLGMSLIKLSVILLFPVAVLKVVLAIMQGGLAWRNLGYLDIAEREQTTEKTE